MSFISTGIFDDELRPQILSVGTTANSALSDKKNSISTFIRYAHETSSWLTFKKDYFFTILSK
jgi:hypothetical protein